jgi:transposase
MLVMLVVAATVPDIVVANCSTGACGAGKGNVGVLLGNGDGTFQTAMTYGSGGYSAMSVRPSIDPELLLRILLIGYLYGISSERKLVEELRIHLAWRWFTGLGFDQEIPHHSTFSKNRHGRFQESNLFQELFEEIVARCVEAGLVKGEHMSVDGSFIQANADHHSRVPRERLAEVAKVNHTVREYLRYRKIKTPCRL